MTIKKFEKLIEDSEFKCDAMELVPISKMRHFQNRLAREFTTLIVRCRLVKQK
jgi:hypothetical protein